MTRARRNPRLRGGRARAFRGAILFDFDGVLADSFRPLYRLNRDALRAVGVELSERGYRDFFLNNIHQGLAARVRDPARLQGVKLWKSARFAAYYRRARLFAFAGRLAAVLSRSAPLAIVSSTRSAHIRRLLRARGLLRHFRAVLGSEALTKSGELRAALKSCRARARDSIFITDTVGDVRAGRNLGLRTAAVAWGFHSRPRLARARPDACFRRPSDLERYLRNGAGGDA